MKKWWILLVAFVAWMGLGSILLRPRHAEAAFERQPSQPPTRIVSMAPNLTEILFSLGLEDNIVGVTQDSDYPSAAASKHTVGTFWQPNIESVIALRPDLVVTLIFEQQRSLTERLTRMGYKCLVIDISTVDDLFKAIPVIATATGRDRQAERVLGAIRSRMTAIRDAAAGKTKVRVLWVVQRNPLRVAGRNTFVNELIELAGGENAIGPTLHVYPPIGGEQVVASAPQVIIEPAMTGGDLARQRVEAVAYWAKYVTVPAVANGRIYVIDGDLVSRLGPRLGEGIETIARCLRPDVSGE
jgi:iron complex transport system substrate-binding protein